jgi:hypothetical protein
VLPRLLRQNDVGHLLTEDMLPLLADLPQRGYLCARHPTPERLQQMRARHAQLVGSTTQRQGSHAACKIRYLENWQGRLAIFFNVGAGARQAAMPMSRP